MRRTWILTCGLLAALCVAGPQAAQGQVRMGLRGGGAIDPDQVHFGFHVQAGIVQGLRFQPNVEIGVGDNLTVIALSPELNHLFKTRGPLSPYIGGGPGINVYDYGRPFGGTNTEVGVNLVFGAEAPLRGPHSFMAELKVGVGNTPELKLTSGITF